MFNPKQMQQLMRQMNIKQENIEAKRVVIETEDGKIIIENPSVVKLEVKGQSSYQIVGEERFEENINEDDVKLVMEQTGVDKEKAIKVLKEVEGKVADAIMKIEEEKEG